MACVYFVGVGVVHQVQNYCRSLALLFLVYFHLATQKGFLRSDPP